MPKKPHRGHGQGTGSGSGGGTTSEPPPTGGGGSDPGSGTIAKIPGTHGAVLFSDHHTNPDVGHVGSLQTPDNSPQSPGESIGTANDTYFTRETASPSPYAPPDGGSPSAGYYVARTKEGVQDIFDSHVPNESTRTQLDKCYKHQPGEHSVTYCDIKLVNPDAYPGAITPAGGIGRSSQIFQWKNWGGKPFLSCRAGNNGISIGSGNTGGQNEVVSPLPFEVWRRIALEVLWLPTTAAYFQAWVDLDGSGDMKKIGTQHTGDIIINNPSLTFFCYGLYHHLTYIDTGEVWPDLEVHYANPAVIALG